MQISEIKIFNTQTKKKQIFTPIDENDVRMYVCGPTVYDKIHIGNARPLIIFDIFNNVLRSKYKNVTYVRNITDVDDKINQRAFDEKITINELTTKTIEIFKQDCEFLNLSRPDFEPKVSETIDEIIQMVEKLVEKKHAYVVDGNVMFDTTTYPQYGEFSRKNLDDLNNGVRIKVSDYKKNPSDFVLWKPAGDDNIGWESPWGFGRPGWHIECSAMAKKFLGDEFDIHGGGIDLIFPHHQNEIAQSVCANNTKNYAKYWMHNGFVMVEGEKMSKSLGNFYTVFDLKQEFSGEQIKFCIISTHYSQPIDFTKQKLNDANKNLEKIYKCLAKYKDIKLIENIHDDEFIEAIYDDLNTPLALSIIWKMIKNIENGDIQTNVSKLKNALKIINIGNDDITKFLPDETFKAPENIVNLCKLRHAAKLEKNFERADQIRDEVFSYGFTIIDLKDGFEIVKNK